MIEKMKSVASKLAILLFLVLSVVILSDTFLCQDSKASDQNLNPVDCCVQCCPSHNLASPTVSLIQVIHPNHVTTFAVENLDFPLEIYPNQIDRPPIV